MFMQLQRQIKVTGLDFRLKILMRLNIESDDNK